MHLFEIVCVWEPVCVSMSVRLYVQLWVCVCVSLPVCATAENNSCRGMPSAPLTGSEVTQAAGSAGSRYSVQTAAAAVVLAGVSSPDSSCTAASASRTSPRSP